MLDKLIEQLAKMGKITVTVKVIPKSSRNEIVSVTDDLIRIKIKAIPEKGKANIELIKFLSKKIGVAKSNISIKGATNQTKTITITK